MPLSRIAPADYLAQLAAKTETFRRKFADFAIPQPEVFASAPLGCRLRAEFRMWHHGDRIDYAMFAADNPKQPVIIEDFPIAAPPIRAAMTRLREALLQNQMLRRSLFQTEFLATLSGELMITLIYHRRLDEAWEAAAREMAADLKVQLIGRSRGQKVVLDRDWVIERFELNGRQLTYQQIASGFSQPNGGVNRHMLAWACQQAAGLGGDLLELYCGNGNFTVALAPCFGRVLATEVSKTSVQAARYNLEANAITNVTLLRMSSEEFTAARAGVRPFRRMEGVDLSSFQFSTLFVDPPRSGLDATTLALAAEFAHVLYISCNPQTLRDNVAELSATHAIVASAVFDQFPYTDHLECGLLLKRR